MTIPNRVIYDGKEMTYEEAIQSIRETALNHEERLTTLEKFAELAKKVGWYVLFFFGAGLVQNPENMRILLEFLRDLSAK